MARDLLFVLRGRRTHLPCMAMDSVDILVAGGGIAGLGASCAFGAAGFSVLCVDPAPPITEISAEGADLRTTAFLNPARRFLAEAGIWRLLAPHATPLEKMRIIDAGGVQSAARLKRDFLASDIGEDVFGYNVPNTKIRAGLLERLAQLDSVRCFWGSRVDGLREAGDGAIVDLDDGRSISAHMVVAADGRDSAVRKALGIGVRRHAFGQHALTFAVTHDRPHRNVSTEVHRSGGPFTLVPLPDHEGRAASAVVWMEPESRARELLAMETTAFERAATKRSAGAQGPLRLATRRTSWPIISQLAHSFFGPRTALVAEAAHVMPPIGAQGLNTSLRDLQSLVDLAGARPEEIGDRTMLQRYHCSRFADSAVRVFGVSALNHASMAVPQPLRDLRAAGLGLIHGLSPLRRRLMRLGLGR